MEHTTVPVLLDRFRSGDRSVLDSLCRRLAERLLIVPVQERAENSGAELLTFHPVERALEGHAPESDANVKQTSVVAFTNPRAHREWNARNGTDLPSICVFGADLGAALSRVTSVTLDEGTPASVVLPHDVVEKIASFKPVAGPDDSSQSEDEAPTVLVSESELRAQLAAGAPKAKGISDREQKLATDATIQIPNSSISTAGAPAESSTSTSSESPGTSALKVEREVTVESGSDQIPAGRSEDSALSKMKRSFTGLFKFS